MSQAAARLAIDPELFESFPHLRVGGFAVAGLGGAAAGLDAQTIEEMWAAARAALEQAGARLEVLASTPGVREWRDAFAACGLKPSTYRGSVEALARRVLKDGQVSTPLPVVDAYCAVSVRHLAPLGAYDVARLPTTELSLRRVRPETDRFEPLGGSPDQFPMSPRVVAYAAGDTVICWSFNHRDSRATCVVPETDAALFFGEAVTPEGGRSLEAALADLRERLRAAGARVGAPAFADAATPELALETP